MTWFVAPNYDMEDAVGFETKEEAVEKAKEMLRYDEEAVIGLFEAKKVAEIYIPDPDPVIEYLK